MINLPIPESPNIYSPRINVIFFNSSIALRGALIILADRKNYKTIFYCQFFGAWTLPAREGCHQNEDSQVQTHDRG